MSTKKKATKASRMLVRWALWAAALGGATACNNSAPTGQAGELGRGRFSYYCTQLEGTPGSDAQCNSDADVATLDQATNLPPMALGSVFGVIYTHNPNEGDTPVPGHTRTVDTSFIGAGPGTNLYVAERAGYAVLYGFADPTVESNDSPDDLVHVYMEAIDHIEFAQSATSGGGGSFVGEVTVPGLTASVTVSGAPVTQLFRVVPVTKDHQLLAGSLPILWTSSDPSVAQIIGDPTQNIVTVQLNAAGTATLHATLATFAGDVTVTVGG